MDPIAEIKRKFQDRPGPGTTITSSSACVEPGTPDGFTVGLRTDKAGYVVHFDGWHEHFTNARDALECFAFGLSEACRLKVVLRGGVAQKWTAQSRAGGDWADVSTTGMILFPYWRKAVTVYKQNHFLRTGAEADASIE